MLPVPIWNPVMRTGQIPAVLLMLSCAWDGLAAPQIPPVPVPDFPRAPDQVIDDPETEAVWARVRAQAAQFRRRTPRIHVFSRAQLKYGLERDDYLHKWVDRPLFVDPSLKGGGGRWLNVNSFARVRENVLAAGLDGLAFFPETTGRSELFQVCTLPGRELMILPEFAATGNLEAKVQLAKAALECPHSFRIDGKVVLTSYRPAPAEEWQAIQAALREACGDRFLLIPSQSFYPPGFRKLRPGEALQAPDIARIQDHLRRTLRVVDGFYYNSLALKNRRYAPEIDREVLLPLVKSVLAEPEFQGKYLGWGAKVGHENLELLGYAFDSTGTSMLRGTMETAILADGDFINCIEWDEQNENTSFRPTVCNSFSTQRILRHYTERLKGRAVSPQPGDDLAVPNLVLSYRRILVAGQALEFDLVNIPDSGQPGRYGVVLRLKNLAGKVVHEFARRELPRHELSDCFLWVPSAGFLAEQVLVPELEVDVEGQGPRFVQSEGWHPIELRASWNWDFKWVKQPLRDLLRPRSVRVDWQPAADMPGFYRLQAAFCAGEPIAYAEVLDGGDTVYAHQGEAENWRENEREIVIAINWQSLAGRAFHLDGRISLKGAAGRWLLRNPKIDLQGQTLWFRHQVSEHHIREVFVALPREEASQAYFEIDLPGVCQGRLDVPALLSQEVIAYPAPQSFNLVFRRFCSQSHLPRHLDQHTGEFSALIKPVSASSVVFLQLVAQSGKIYRGQVRALLPRSGATVPLTVYSVAEDKTVRLEVDRDQVTTVTYLFQPDHGAALLCRGPNRALWGLAGGFRPQVVGRGSGETGYGNPLSGEEPVPPLDADPLRTAPAWERLTDGDWALRFADQAFVSLPQALIPAFASFVLRMEVMPGRADGVQPLLHGGTPAFTLSLRDGLLEGTYYRNQREDALLRCKTGLRVEPGRWSRIEVYFDQTNLQFAVNGVRSQMFPCSGYHRYTALYSIGYGNKRFFHGGIRSLCVAHIDPSAAALLRAAE